MGGRGHHCHLAVYLFHKVNSLLRQGRLAGSSSPPANRNTMRRGKHMSHRFVLLALELDLRRLGVKRPEFTFALMSEIDHPLFFRQYLLRCADRYFLVGHMQNTLIPFKRGGDLFKTNRIISKSMTI